MNLKGKLIAFFILTIIILFTWLMIQNKSGKSYIYADFGVNIPEEYQLLGLDVSHYQGDINWPQVDSMKIEGDSLEFVFIKCTEGTSKQDKKCKENVEGAEESDLEFGLYHFFHFDLSATKQAAFFSEEIAGYDFTLKPVIDVELRGNFSKEKLTDSVYVFLNLVEKNTSVRPIIYTNENFYLDYFKDSYLKNELYWIANYNGECESMQNENVIIWQFSESGTVNGISGKVDLNVAKPEFRDLIKTKP